MAKRKTIKAAASQAHPIIGIEAPVEIIQAAESDGKKTPPKFNVTAYTGGPMSVGGWDLPIVIDLAGMQFGNSLVANLDHDASKRVGNVTERSTDGGILTLGGNASARTASRDEVVGSAADGFVWQASVEAQPGEVVEVEAGKTADANGKTHAGPIYMIRTSTLKGFAFVSHGADDNTSVAIAAGRKSDGTKEIEMKKELREFIEAMLPGIEVDSLSKEAIANLEADFEGKGGIRKVGAAKPSAGNIFAERKAERDRVDQIREIADKYCERRPHDIEAIEKMYDHAIAAKMTVQEFRLEMAEATIPEAHTVFSPASRESRDLSAAVIEAAICTAGRLKDVDKQFDDRTLQAAHDRFKHGIGLKELFLLGAQANGYRGNGGYNVDINVQRAAFGMAAPNRIHATTFSTISLPNIFSNVANKFIREGWMSVDQTPLRVADIQPVNDFKQRTTVSLTGGLQFEQLAADGSIPHGEIGETVYTNQADTYAKMFAITRKDIINDDLGALTRVPRRLGRGGMLKLNDLFWTVFLDNSTFFSVGNLNVSTADGTLGLTGLQQAETIFMNQTDPDGLPLGSMPAILLVPPSLKATALTLMNSQLTITGANTTLGNTNVWQGRFRVESSPYMENSTYTGFSAVAWYLLADPSDIPVVEIVALNGRVEPQVDTADADFNVLGVQMRGYSDVGVAMQEFRGGVRADGSAP